MEQRAAGQRDSRGPAEGFDALDDAALVRASAGGAREAFDALVRRHQRAVYQVCYRFVGNQADASDLAQDVFLRAYRGLGRFKGDAAFSTWLHRIAVNVALTRVKGPRAEMVPLEPERHADASREAPDEAMAREERRARVRAAVARLPRKQRATLVLKVYQELPHAEVARILGNSVGAAKANLFHALRNLRALLEGEGD